MSEEKKTLDLKAEIYALLDSLKCRREERNGIQYVTTPDGTIWDFTSPMISRRSNEL